jgi:hypothetical protein
VSARVACERHERHYQVIEVIVWISRLAQFLSLEIINQNRAMCKQYFPIGSFWHGWAMKWFYISRTGNILLSLSQALLASLLTPLLPRLETDVN